MILVNGCSFTYGDELANPEEQRWSSHLGRLLNKEVVNISAPGSSNAKILRDTLNWLNSPETVNSEIEGIVIMWSAFERVEYISLYAGHNYDNESKLINEPFLQMSPSRITRDNRSLGKTRLAWESFYGEIYTHETGIVNTINYMGWINWVTGLLGCECMQLWFHEGNKSTFRKTFAKPRLDIQGSRLHRIFEPIQAKLLSLPAKCKIGSNDRYLTFNQFTDEKRLDRMPLGHPGPIAHERYAQYMFNIIQELNLDFRNKNDTRME